MVKHCVNLAIRPDPVSILLVHCHAKRCAHACHAERSAAEPKHLKTLNCAAYQSDTASSDHMLITVPDLSA